MKSTIIIFLMIFLFVASCIEQQDTDEEKPQIELVNPLPCDTLYFGNSFRFQLQIKDKSGLGNLSMGVHHNFGHHDHGIHESCEMDPPKDAIQPYFNEWTIALPSNKTEFLLDTLLELPYFLNDTGAYDTGDYHFHIYVTDDEGYQSFTTLDVKMLYKED